MIKKVSLGKKDTISSWAVINFLTLKKIVKEPLNYSNSNH
jgi:hypothetical protein